VKKNLPILLYPVITVSTVLLFQHSADIIDVSSAVTQVVAHLIFRHTLPKS